MDIVTYQETMKLLAKIDSKGNANRNTERTEREEELTPFQQVLGAIFFIGFTIAIHTIAYYLQ